MQKQFGGTGSKVYSFDKQLEQGQCFEKELDEFFSQWYCIEPVSMDCQRLGIDRIFTRRDNGCVFKIEYKADIKATQTGNAFVETVSVDATGKPGWALSSQSDFLLYYLPKDLLVYIIAFENLRNCLDRWQSKYPKRHITNEGYKTIGIIVPLREFERVSTQVVCL